MNGRYLVSVGLRVLGVGLVAIGLIGLFFALLSCVSVAMWLAPGALPWGNPVSFFLMTTMPHVAKLVLGVVACRWSTAIAALVCPEEQDAASTRDIREHDMVSVGLRVLGVGLVAVGTISLLSSLASLVFLRELHAAEAAATHNPFIYHLVATMPHAVKLVLGIALCRWPGPFASLACPADIGS